MHIIGIDIGTTSICGVKLSLDGRVLASRTVSSHAFLPGCAPWEKIQSPEKILALAMEILEDLADAETKAIGVTGQMHGIVYTDGDGRAVSPLYTWQDGRGNQPYGSTTYAAHLGSYTGYGNVTDFYNRDKGLRPGEAVAYCTIQDWLVMQLCGLKRPVLHASDAASFGAYDLQRNQFTIPFTGTITADYQVAGTWRGIPVGVAIGDNQASVFSTLADPEAVLCNVGTGSQVSVIAKAPLWQPNIETRPYFEGQYLIVGSALCGGRAYSLLKDFFAGLLGQSEGQVYERMDRLLEQDGPTLTVDPRFAGTRANPSLCGSITGITTENFTPAALTRGVLAGMVEELYAMYEAMGAGRKGLVGSGNGVRKNAHFVRMAESRFGAAMQIPAHVEEAAFGAALFAAISAGLFQNAAAAQKLIRYL